MIVVKKMLLPKGLFLKKNTDKQLRKSKRTKDEPYEPFLLAVSENGIFWHILLVIKSTISNEVKREMIESKIISVDRNTIEQVFRKK